MQDLQERINKVLKYIEINLDNESFEDIYDYLYTYSDIEKVLILQIIMKSEMKKELLKTKIKLEQQLYCLRNWIIALFILATLIFYKLFI